MNTASVVRCNVTMSQSHLWTGPASYTRSVHVVQFISGDFDNSNIGNLATLFKARSGEFHRSLPCTRKPPSSCSESSVPKLGFQGTLS